MMMMMMMMMMMVMMYYLTGYLASSPSTKTKSYYVYCYILFSSYIFQSIPPSSGKTLNLRRP